MPRIVTANQHTKMSSTIPDALQFIPNSSQAPEAMQSIAESILDYYIQRAAPGLARGARSKPVWTIHVLTSSKADNDALLRAFKRAKKQYVGELCGKKGIFYENVGSIVDENVVLYYLKSNALVGSSATCLFVECVEIGTKALQGLCCDHLVYVLPPELQQGADFAQWPEEVIEADRVQGKLRAAGLTVGGLAAIYDPRPLPDTIDDSDAAATPDYYADV